MASIFQRGNSWSILYYKDGRKFQKSLSHFNGGRPVKDKRTAEFLKRQVEMELLKGSSPIAAQNTKITALLDEYERDCLKRNVAKTVHDDMKRIRDFVDSAYIRKADDITLVKVDRYTEHLTIPTANRLITNLKTFLNYLVDRDLISKNPLDKAKKFRQTTNPPEYYTKKEMVRLIKAAKEVSVETYKLTCICLYTGIRIKEMMNLEWRDFDWKKRLLTVMNKDDFKTKSRKFRVIPVSKYLIDNIKPLAEDGYCIYDGKPRTYDPKKHLYRAQKIAEVKVSGPHILRHTFASRLVQEGVSIYKVSKWLGHSSVRVTEVYAHLIPQNDSEIDRI